MARKIVQQTGDGISAEYDHWATEDQMERLIKSLTSNGLRASDINNIVAQLEKMNNGDKVDRGILKQTLANDRREAMQDRKEAKDLEDHQKEQSQFWKDSAANAKKTFQVMKDQNFADALKQAGDLAMVPVDGLSGAFSRVAGIVTSFGAGLTNVIGSIFGSFKIFQGMLGSILGGLGKAVGGLVGGIVTLGSALLGIIDAVGDSFMNLYDTGINLARGAQQGGDGLARLTSAAAAAQMSVGAFAEFLAEGSRVTVAVGVDAMAELSNSVRKALIPMGSLALTTAETNEYINDYLELQRGLGVLNTMDDLKQAQSQTEYLVMLTSLTAITGKRRKQIAQEIQDAMKNTALTAWMLNMNAEDRAAAEKTTKRLTGFLTAINPQAAQSFTEALGKGDVYLTEWGQDMAAAGFTQEMAAYNQLITQIRNGRVSEEQAEAEMLRIQEMMKANKPAIAQMANMAQYGMAASEAAVAHASALQGADLAAIRLKNSLSGPESLIGSFSELTTRMQSTWTTFIAGMFKDQTFKESLTAVTDEFEKIMAPDGKFMVGMRELAAELAPNIISGMKSLSDYLLTDGFKQTIRDLPSNIMAFGRAIASGLRYIRGIFFKEVEVDPNTLPPSQRGKQQWVLKSGEDIMESLKVAMSSLWDTISDPKGVVVTSLIKGFETLGTYMVEPITNVMVAAFTAIGQMLKDAIRDTIRDLWPSWMPGRPDSSQTNSLRNDAARLNTELSTNTNLETGQALTQDEFQKRKAQLAKIKTAQEAELNASENMESRASGGQIIATTVAAGAAYKLGKGAYKGSRSLYGAVKGAAKVTETAAETAMKNADDVADAAEKATKTGKTVGKAVSKSLLKKIPIVSLFAGLAFGIDRMLEGDFKGGGLEMVSGAAGTIPFVGTAASVGIDGYLLNEDLKKDGGGFNMTAPVSAAKEAAAVAHGTGEGSVQQYQLSQRERLVKEAALLKAQKQEDKWLKRGKEDRAAKYTERIKQLEAELGRAKSNIQLPAVAEGLEGTYSSADTELINGVVTSNTEQTQILVDIKEAISVLNGNVQLIPQAVTTSGQKTANAVKESSPYAN